MSIEDRTRWDARYRGSAAPGGAARASVLDLARPPSGDCLALDVACGAGRHCEGLTRAGWQVVALDVSGIALRHVLDRCEPGTVLAVQGDTDQWPLREEAFDLIVQVDFLERRLLSVLERSLKPGGLLLIDTFLDQGRANESGPSRPEFLLKPGELPAVLGSLHVCRYDEMRGATARACFVGRKPVRKSAS